MLTLTKKLVRKLKTERGGWRKEQLDLLRLIVSLRRGWHKRLVGIEVTEEFYERVYRAGRLSAKDTVVLRDAGTKPKKWITPEQYQDYLKTDYWREVAKKVKERAGYRCQVCNSPYSLEAHHRTYEHRGDELNHLDDLVCLCNACHDLFHKNSRLR